MKMFKGFLAAIGEFLAQSPASPLSEIERMYVESASSEEDRKHRQRVVRSGVFRRSCY
jgi:hypothetical protein